MTSDHAIEAAFREEAPAVLATLIRQVGDFGLAEDALQDAFAAAVASWRRDGIPERPGAWITTIARRRAIDRLRRERGQADRIGALQRLSELDTRDDDPMDAPAVTDDQLRLIFTCCHPALAMEARVGLTLRALGGLTTAEVARALLVSEAAMARRLTRAKQKIAAAGIPYRVPDHDELPERLRGVLAVVYLVFNEGYAAASGDRLVRGELCGEAIRLGRLLVRLMPDDAETEGLLALMLLQDARRGARVDDHGAYVPLDAQDRSRWDAGRLAEGRTALDRALSRGTPGPYQLQAAIAALHCEDMADWPQIAALYGELARVAPSPVVELNRAVAVMFAGGDGLAVLAPLLADARLADYQPLHAAHAEMLRRAGDRFGADAAYARAITLSGNAVERAELERRRAALAT